MGVSVSQRGWELAKKYYSILASPAIYRPTIASTNYKPPLKDPDKKHFLENKHTFWRRLEKIHTIRRKLGKIHTHLSLHKIHADPPQAKKRSRVKAGYLKRRQLPLSKEIKGDRSRFKEKSAAGGVSPGRRPSYGVLSKRPRW